MNTGTVRLGRLGALLFVLGCIGAGCKKGHSLEGSWHTVVGTMVFHDKNFSIQTHAEGGGFIASGTYTLENDKLTLAPTEVTFKADDPTKQAALEEKVASLKPEVMEAVQEISPAILSWTDEDHVTMNARIGPPATLSRLEVEAASK